MCAHPALVLKEEFQDASHTKLLDWSGKLAVLVKIVSMLSAQARGSRVVLFLPLQGASPHMLKVFINDSNLPRLDLLHVNAHLDLDTRCLPSNTDSR